MSNYKNNLNSMNETENRHSLNTCDWIDEKRALKVKIVLSFTPRGLPSLSKCTKSLSLTCDCTMFLITIFVSYILYTKLYLRRYLGIFNVSGRQAHLLHINDQSEIYNLSLNTFGRSSFPKGI